MADSAGDPDAARPGAKRGCPGKRDQDLVCELRRGGAGDPAAWRARQFQLLSKVFAFAANSDPSGVADIGNSPVFNSYIARAGKEYEAMSPTPGEYKAFLAQITKMWETQPNWTDDDLQNRYTGMDRRWRP
jgi:hypothetical protein